MKAIIPLFLAGAALAVSTSLSTLRAADAPETSKSTTESGDKKPAGRKWCERGGGGREGHRFDHRRDGGAGFPFRELNLTDDQKEKVKAIMESKKPLLDAIRQEHMEKMKYVLGEAEKEIRPVLTPEQQQVLDDLKKLREDRAKLRGNNGEKKAE